MKKIILLTVLLNLSYVSKAQTVDMYASVGYGDANVYYKDTNNFQNQFEGTWVYQQGLARLEVQFRKKEEMTVRPGPNQYYADVLVGEYKYIDANGVERVNSLANINVEHPSLFDYNIRSRMKIGNNVYPVCTTCPPGTKRLSMQFDEPANDDFGLAADFMIRRVVDNGVEKLIVQFISIDLAAGFSKTDLEAPSTFTYFSLPYGNYTLIKQ